MGFTRVRKGDQIIMTGKIAKGTAGKVKDVYDTPGGEKVHVKLNDGREFEVTQNEVQGTRI